MLFAMSAVLIGVVGIFYVRRRSSAQESAARSALSGRRSLDAARAEQVVRRRQDDAPQAVGIVRRQLREEARRPSAPTVAELCPPSVASIQRFGKKMSPVRWISRSIARLVGMYFSDDAARSGWCR